MCNCIGQKQRNWIVQFALYSLWANSSGSVNPWADTHANPCKSELSPMGDSSICTKHLCSLN